MFTSFVEVQYTSVPDCYLLTLEFGIIHPLIDLMLAPYKSLEVWTSNSIC